MLADLAVTLIYHADVLILQITGVLDITTVNRFAAEIAAVLAACSPQLVVFDLCALDLLAAAGIRHLVQAVGSCVDRRIAVAVSCDPGTVVYRVLQMLRVDEYVDVYSTTREAVAALSA